MGQEYILVEVQKLGSWFLGSIAILKVSVVSGRKMLLLQCSSFPQCTSHFHLFHNCSSLTPYLTPSLTGKPEVLTAFFHAVLISLSIHFPTQLLVPRPLRSQFFATYSKALCSSLPKHHCSTSIFLILLLCVFSLSPNFFFFFSIIFFSPGTPSLAFWPSSLNIPLPPPSFPGFFKPPGYFSPTSVSSSNIVVYQIIFPFDLIFYTIDIVFRLER